MIKRNRRPTPPGEILKAHYLEPRGLTITRFAELTELSRKHISGIVNARPGVRITAGTAVRFAKVLGTTDRFWMNLQNAVDLYDEQRKLARWKPAEAPAALAAND